ncbi:hypothetical protein D6D19_06304 [Aureobasidium pullulans]|uniref:Uncharacterized protein n=1 Tax=Aureobasidium pullulans TaxID=5580 RepID=A0A4S9A1A4_AURPU|nr:hypothetical protein D6D19_06304 [Aureobasidium pullulans]
MPNPSITLTPTISQTLVPQLTTTISLTLEVKIVHDDDDLKLAIAQAVILRCIVALVDG